MNSSLSISEAKARANDVLDEARAIQYTTPSLDGPFDGEDLEDTKLVSQLVSQLMTLARQRTLGLQDVTDTLQVIRSAERDALMKAVKRISRCHAPSSSLKLYSVTNKAGNDIKILAESADCARFFAYNSGHVREEANAKVFLYNEKHIAELKISGSATGRAIREGVPGVLKSVGSGIVIEQAGKVYVPLTVIDVTKN